MSKKFLLPILLTVSFGLFASEGLTSAAPTLETSYAPPTPTCPVLSAEQESFAEMLSPGHKTLFCLDFSQAEREEAMALATPRASSSYETPSVPMSPDMAVETVLKKKKKEQGGAKGDMQMPQNRIDPRHPYNTYP